MATWIGSYSGFVMPRPDPSLCGSAMIRRVCALGALLGLLFQGSTGGHMLLVEHTRCAEHGELVHNGEAHHHVGTEHAEPHSPGLESAPDHAGDEAHEHCALTADRRDALDVVDDCHLLARVARAPNDLAPSQTRVSPAGDLFRVAPKNSPPA